MSFIVRWSVDLGPELGPEMDTVRYRLELRADEGVLQMEQNRSQSDGEGEPIGRFSMPADGEIVGRVRAALAAVSFSAMPPSGLGGPGASAFTIEVEDGEAKRSAGFSSRDIPILEHFEVLLNELSELSIDLEERATAAIVASLREPDPQGRFALVLSNVGTEPLYVADPRLLATFPDEWAGIRIAELPEEEEGYTADPLEWGTLGLAPPPAPLTDRDVLLGPGESIELPTLPWLRPSSARYLAQGVFSSYAGASARDDVFRVRGAAFSESIEIA
jgi:hypothetical protein